MINFLPHFSESFTSSNAAVTAAATGTAEKLLQEVKAAAMENECKHKERQKQGSDNDVKGILSTHITETRKELVQLLELLRTIIHDILDKIEKVNKKKLQINQQIYFFQNYNSFENVSKNSKSIQ